VLYEIIEGRPVFDPSLTLHALMNRVLTPSRRPEFQATPGPVQDLIARGWGVNGEERPSFDEILTVLQRNEFSLFQGVDAPRIREYIETVIQWENQNPIDQL
jgi:hypothetical protein